MEGSASSAERMAIFVGAATAVAGAALLAAPERVGDSLGVSDKRGLRILGGVDVVVAAGLLRGRPRWPWLAVRAACNPPTAIYLVSLARRSEVRGLTAVAAFLCAATVADVRGALQLRSAGR